MSKADVPLEVQFSIAVKPVYTMVAHILKEHQGNLAMQMIIVQMIADRMNHAAEQLTQAFKEKGEAGKAEIEEIERLLTQDTQEAQQ
nr:hypothetical protein [uncultured Pseudomonas sp.]